MSALIWIVGPVNVLRIREDEEAGLGAGRWDIAIGVAWVRALNPVLTEPEAWNWGGKSLRLNQDLLFVIHGRCGHWFFRLLRTLKLLLAMA